MHFQIIGEITDIETFATGREIRELPACVSSMVAGAGESGRVTPGFG